MCQTRWVERIKVHVFAYFNQAFLFLEEALGVMVSSKTDENQKNYPGFKGWESDTKTKACSLIKDLDFEFLMSFTTIYPYPCHHMEVSLSDS